MGFNQNTGVYTPASGALSASPGQVVQSAVWDNVFTDLSNAHTTVAQALQATWGQRNIIGSNGGMEVWQRGAGGSASIAINAATNQYTADRWYIGTGANQASTVAQVAGIVNGSRWASKVQRNSGQTGATQMQFGFPLDSDECAMIQGQICALSFTAKAGANWSPASGTLFAFLAVGTGAPIKQSLGYTNQTLPINGSAANLTTTATRYTFVSSVVALTTTQAEVIFLWTPVGTAGADDSFTIDDVQLEILPSATSPIAGFERWSFERMLLACKRHYRKTFPYSVAPVQNGGTPGVAAVVSQAATASGIWWNYGPVSLRATAALTAFNPSGAGATAQDMTQGASLAVSLDAAGMNSPEGILIYVSASGATITAAAKDVIAIHLQADAGI